LEGLLPFLQIRLDAATFRQIKVNTIPFYTHVAVVTQAHDVLDEVGVIDILKRRYWFDVVNVECPTKLGLPHLTTLTEIVVKLTSEPLQGPPVGPVIIRMAPPPAGIPYASEGPVRAVRRTEAETPSGGKQAPRKNAFRSAHFASPSDRLFSQNAASQFGRFSPCLPAFLSDCIWCQDDTLNKSERAAFLVARARAEDEC
jgi:hypothetical protein